MVADVLELRVLILTGLNEGTRGLGASTTLCGGCLYRTWEAGYSSFTKMPPVMVCHSSFGRIKMPWGHSRQCIFLDFSRVRIFTMQSYLVK